MITPNKVITLRESALGTDARSSCEEKGLAGQPRQALYDKVGRDFESIDQFLLAVDVLYVLGQIDVDPSTGMVTYAD